MDKAKVLWYLLCFIMVLSDVIIISDARRLLLDFLIGQRNRKNALKIHSEQTLKNRVNMGYIHPMLKKYQKTFDSALADFKEYYGRHCNDNTKPYPRINESLSYLKARGYKIAVVSNKVDFATKSLCRDYFGGLIEVAIGQREGIEKKPAPDSVFEAMRLLDSKNAIYIGDSDVDIMTAKNSNLPCIAVTWGFRDKDFLYESGGRIFADTTREMLEIIEKT